MHIAVHADVDVDAPSVLVALVLVALVTKVRAQQLRLACSHTGLLESID